MVLLVWAGRRGAVSASRFKENRVRHDIRSGGNPSASREDFGEGQTETGDTGYAASPVPWRSGLLEVHKVIVVGGERPQHRDRLGGVVRQSRDAGFAA